MSAKTSPSHNLSQLSLETKAEQKVPTGLKTAPEHLKSDPPSSTALDSTSTSALPSSECITSMPAPPVAAVQKEDHAEDGPRFAKLPKTPKFKWGIKEASEFIRDDNQTFDVIAKWRKNVYRLPGRSAGKGFGQASAKMKEAYHERSPME